MNCFALPRNFIDDPEKLLWKKKFVEAKDNSNHHQEHPQLLKPAL